MADRLRWWVIPGALIVLLRVVTLGGEGAPAPGVVPAAAEAGVATPRDAVARRQRVHKDELVTSGALQVTVPASAKGQRGELRIWRRVGGRREAEPWLVCKPRVRSDATLPIAGLAAGRYDLTFVPDQGIALVAEDVEVPGHVALQPAN